MPTTIINRFKPTLKKNDHPYRNGAWTPNYIEYDASDMKVVGEIPTDIDGIYVRNTENPMHEAIGVYHPFDGDAMLHSMRFQDGNATYRNRFVRTDGFLEELKEGRSLWAGIAAKPSQSLKPGVGARGALKDASSTDVIVHNKHIISTFYQCGDGYRLDPSSLETLGKEPWAPADGISAHPKVDLNTGELLFFNYSKTAPYMHYGVVGPDSQLKHLTPIPLPGPRLPHDMAFTENYSILIDLPMFWDPKLLDRELHVVKFYPDMPTRFAIIPRYGNETDIRWFEAAPTFVLHWLNAYEEGDEIVLDGYFQENPQPAPIEAVPHQFSSMMSYMDMHSMSPRLHRWRFNMKTGQVRESHLDERCLEFGTFNQVYAGKVARYAYSTTSEPGWFLFNGFVKHDLETQNSQQFALEKGQYGSEAPFAPRNNAQSEDDGYLVSFITDMNSDTSECVLIDALDVVAGPVCRIQLPHRISSGTHAIWASGDAL